MDIDQMIEEFRKQDYTHFDDFYQLTSKQIYFSAITIVKDHALAEDILQETYLSFLNHLSQYKRSQYLCLFIYHC